MLIILTVVGQISNMKNSPNQWTWFYFLKYPNFEATFSLMCLSILQKLKKCNNRLISTTGRNMYTWIFYHMAIYTCPSCVQLKSSWNENNPNCDEIKLFLSNSTVVTHKLLKSYADISWPFKTISWSMHFFSCLNLTGYLAISHFWQYIPRSI